mmetsp:Transcript_70198/g.199023  ORF Transcript_70198/g.199023 Transcript_70198/m.199023 type:complete len:317 (+) Transcript_70198:1278-2228(+)
MSWICVPPSLVTATATGCPASSSCTLETGPTTASPSMVRRCFRPLGPSPKTAVLAPLVNANTPLVRCQGMSLKGPWPLALSFFREMASPPAPVPQRLWAERLSPLRSTRCPSATMKGEEARPFETASGRSVFVSTLPLETSMRTACAPAPPGAAARAQRLASSSEAAAAKKRAFWPSALEATDHSCLPPRVRASISDSRTITASCFWPAPASTRSTTASAYARCHVRSPELPFQACTAPSSETLMSARPLERRSLRPPFWVATRRHWMLPSFSSTEATTPEAEATKMRSEASAEKVSEVGLPICCSSHSYWPISSS